MPQNELTALTAHKHQAQTINPVYFVFKPSNSWLLMKMSAEALYFLSKLMLVVVSIYAA